MQYARLTPDLQSVERIIELDVQYVASLAESKRAVLRSYLIDAAPTPGANQKIAAGPVVINLTTARQTWILVNKTQTEIDAENQITELAALKLMVQALTEDIDLGITAAPTTAAQAFLHIQELKRQILRLNRAVRWMLKQQG